MAITRRVWLALTRRWRVLAPLLVVTALSVPVRVKQEASARLPHAPHTLAHILADFSRQPDIESWAVVEDSSNYSTWRYAVTYACGPRCAGHARVTAQDAGGGAPAHGQAAAHRVTVEREHCTQLPLLLWPTLCEESQTVTLIKQDSAGQGAVLHAHARASCPAILVLTGACSYRLQALLDFSQLY